MADRGEECAAFVQALPKETLGLLLRLLGLGDWSKQVEGGEWESCVSGKTFRYDALDTTGLYLKLPERTDIFGRLRRGRPHGGSPSTPPTISRIVPHLWPSLLSSLGDKITSDRHAKASN